MGFATAKLLASHGAKLSLADRNKEGLEEALKHLDGQGHVTHVVDVTSSQSVNSWIELTREQLGPLDGAVNMAGITGSGARIDQQTDEVWDQVMAVNAKGVFNCIRAQVPNMKPQGSIVSTRRKSTHAIYGSSHSPVQVSAASTLGLVGFPRHSVYCASKHAVIGLTRAVAKENPDIRVNCVAPGKLQPTTPTLIPKGGEYI